MPPAAASSGRRRPLRVLVAGLRSPTAEGGVESHARHLYPHVASMGCEVEIVVRQPSGSENHPAAWGCISLKPIWSPRSAGLEALIHTLLATIYAIRTRPDVYHIHAIGPALFAPLARLFGIRVVVTHHGADYDREKWGFWGRLALRLGERVGMRSANGLISVSATIRELVADRHGVACTFIPNGVNEPVATDSIGTLEELGLDAGRYVLQVSRFVPEKRQADLVRAFLNSSLGAAWRLALVGGYQPDNDYAQQVQALAAGNDRIVLAGFRSGTALTELYQNAGIFVLPSSHEGLPIALLEALSFGLPVIASDIPANLEVSLPEHCYFALGDLGQLADRLEDVAGGQQAPEACAERRRWVLERYDWQRIAAETVTVYRRALSNAPTGERSVSAGDQG